MNSELRPRHNQLTWPFRTLLALLFLVVVLAGHGGSLHGEFVLDDSGAILDNPSIVTWSSITDVFTGGDFTTVAGRPLLNLSLAINYAMGETQPDLYHAVNYLIHACAAFVLFSLVRRLLAEFAETEQRAVPLALTISVLWCIHPLTINAVSYVVQRAESIASGFYLLVLWGFTKGVQTSQKRWFFVSVVSAWMGGLTKEIIATAPLTVIVLDGLVLTRDWRMSLQRHWRIVLWLASSWIPLAICMWLSKSRSGTVGFDMGITLSQHVQTQVWAIARYLRLSVWPQPLIFDYGDRFVIQDSASVLASAGVLLVLGVILVWLVGRRSPWAFPGLMLCLLLSPTTVIPIATQTVAEHRMYLASACVVAAAVLLIDRIVQRLSRHSVVSVSRQSMQLGIVVMPVGLVLLLMTVQRTRHFVTSESLWKDTVQKLPTNQRAVLGIAEARFRAKSDDEATIQLCNQVMAMPGKFAMNGQILRGQVFERQGESQKALDDLTEAIDACPPDKRKRAIVAYKLRGQIYAQRKEFERALEDFNQTIALRPQVIEYYHLRAILLRDLARYDDSLRDLEQAATIDPANINTDLVRSSVDFARGDFPRALSSFDRVLAKQPEHVSARRGRIRVYVQLNRWDEAMREIRRLQAEGRRVDEKLTRDVEEHLANHRAEVM